MSIDALIEQRIQQRRENQKARFYQSIPHKLRDYDLETLLDLDSSYNNLTAQGKRTLTRFMNHPTPFLLLHGASGLGKTVIGAAVCLELLKRSKGHSALYLSSATLLGELSFGGRNGDNTLDIIHKASAPDILFLDDVGAGMSMTTQTRRDGIWEIVDRRWSSERKITVMTTNLPVSKQSSQGDQTSLPEWFGPSAWDRISGVGTLTAVHFSGISLRGNPGRTEDEDMYAGKRSERTTSVLSEDAKKHYEKASIQEIGVSSTIPDSDRGIEEDFESYNDFEGYDDDDEEYVIFDD